MGLVATCENESIGSMTTVELPPNVRRQVPVTCEFCGQDMTFSVTYFRYDRRRWVLHCTYCGEISDEQDQRRRTLRANGGTIYIGTYWA